MPRPLHADGRRRMSGPRPAPGWWSWVRGSRGPGRRASSPTGVPRSSRSSRRTATRPASSGGCWAATCRSTRCSSWTTGASGPSPWTCPPSGAPMSPTGWWRAPTSSSRTSGRPPSLGRTRPRSGAGAASEPGLRHHHRLRARGTRCRQGGLRRRGLLGSCRHRRGPPGARRAAPVPARRHGGPHGRHDRRCHGERGARRAGPDGQRPGGFHLTPAPGRVHDRLRRQHRHHVGPHVGRGDTGGDVQPDGEQLHGGRWAHLLDRRSRR